MRFLSLIRKSIYSPPFYGDVLRSPFRFSLRYFLTFLLGLAVALTIYFSARLIPIANEFLKTVGPAIVQNFPEGLTVTIENGTAAVNQDEPYVVALPAELVRETEGDGGSDGRTPINLLVVDTRDDVSVERFRELDTLVWLAKEHVVFSQNGRGIRIESLAQVPNAVIDKKMARSLAGGIETFRRFVAPLIVFGTFFVMVILLGGTLIYLLFGALVVLLAAKLRKVPAGYGKAYQVGLHAVTLSLLFDALFLIAPVPTRVPFFGTILLFVVAFANLRPVPEPVIPIAQAPSEPPPSQGPVK